MPNRLSKPIITFIIIGIAVASIFGIKLLKSWGAHGADAGLARSAGNKNAKLHIVEYLDFQCPACGHGAKQLKNYLKLYPDKIYLEVNYFPLGGHVHSLEATKYAECSARQGKFWPYFDLVFERQDQWRDLFDAKPAFEKIAEDIELNLNKLHSCLTDDKIREKILKEKDAGQTLGIKSTPTYFINGTMFVGVKPMMDEVERVLKSNGTDLTKKSSTDDTDVTKKGQ